MITQRICESESCTTILSRYNPTNICACCSDTHIPSTQDDVYQSILPQESKKLAYRLCADCGIKVLPKKKTNNLCILCERSRAKVQKTILELQQRNFYLHIQNTDADPIENPTAMQIVETVAYAYRITKEEIFSASRNLKAAWTRHVAISFIKEFLDTRPSHVCKLGPEFKSFTSQRVFYALSSVQKTTAKNSDASTAVKRIRARFHIKEPDTTKATATP